MSKKNKKLYLILCIILLSVIDYAYHAIFYSRTEAMVINFESKIVGEIGTSWGAFPRTNKSLEVEFKTRDGIRCTAKLSANSKNYIRLGSTVHIRYKNSDPKKCYLD